MAKLPEPREYDAVEGGSSPPPLNGVILGGIEGVKRRLASASSDSNRIAALKEAVKYGKEGLELVAQIVQNESGPVQWAAHDLLWQRVSEKRKQKLLEYFPWRSEVGVDYTKLRDLLAAKKFLAADEETTRVMLKVVGADKRGYFTPKQIQTFPRTDLQTIDQLWVHYSGGKYGFSVQKRIWQEEKNLESFVCRVGWGELRLEWRKTGEWFVSYPLPLFKFHARQGYFPIVGSWGFAGFESWWWWEIRDYVNLG